MKSNLSLGRWIAACLSAGPMMSVAAPYAFAAAPDLVQPLYTRTQNVVYGSAVIHASTEPIERDLFLDAYVPVGMNEGLPARPAILLMFGGAFHRGEKGDFTFDEDGSSDSSMADYCKMLAANGYVCFSLEYRLVPEDPALPKDLDAANLLPQTLMLSPNATERMELVRRRMGLPPFDEVTRQHLWNGGFAAVEDFGTALAYVKVHAGDYGVDPDRIAIGGFSAGAITAINLAYGKQGDVAAVVALSGGIWGYDLQKTIETGDPPILMFAGQNDLPAIRSGGKILGSLLKAHSVDVSQAWVPSFGHFYPMGVPSLGADFEKLTVKARILRFLDKALGEEHANKE